MSHGLERLTAQRLYMLRVLGTWCRVCILVSGRVTRTTYGAYYSFRATQLLRRMFLTVLNIGDHDMDVLPLSKSFKPRKYDRTRWVMKKQRNLSPVFPCAWTNRTRGNGPCQRSSLRERNLAQVILQATADCGSGSLSAARLQAVRSLYHFERTVKLCAANLWIALSSSRRRATGSNPCVIRSNSSLARSAA